MRSPRGNEPGTPGKYTMRNLEPEGRARGDEGHKGVDLPWVRQGMKAGDRGANGLATRYRSRSPCRVFIVHPATRTGSLSRIFAVRPLRPDDFADLRPSFVVAGGRATDLWARLLTGTKGLAQELPVLRTTLPSSPRSSTVVS